MKVQHHKKPAHMRNRVTLNMRLDRQALIVKKVPVLPLVSCTFEVNSR